MLIGENNIKKQAKCHVIKENEAKNYFLVFGEKPTRGQPKPPPPHPYVAPAFGEYPRGETPNRSDAIIYRLEVVKNK